MVQAGYARRRQCDAPIVRAVFDWLGAALVFCRGPHVRGAEPRGGGLLFSQQQLRARPSSEAFAGVVRGVGRGEDRLWFEARFAGAAGVCGAVRGHFKGANTGAFRVVVVDTHLDLGGLAPNNHTHTHTRSRSLAYRLLSLPRTNPRKQERLHLQIRHRVIPRRNSPTLLAALHSPRQVMAQVLDAPMNRLPIARSAPLRAMHPL